jgi:hypothetical protein
MRCKSPRERAFYIHTYICGQNVSTYSSCISVVNNMKGSQSTKRNLLTIPKTVNYCVEN